MDKIRVGFVGAGMIGPIHMENLSHVFQRGRVAGG
jgi:hypothetical protein